ncbi:skp1 family, dimerization domain-containing protein [Ditylenchus destructor]|uniref:Skp1-related protein n=1 Tax=Ditylenchus destructor TaxID=166010 RepID=A0AAD4NDB7_9BILA|nr:skp1 family, dimerization domain-containing protein [Ditylenchus destructor]
MSEDIIVFVHCCDEEVVKADFEAMKQSQVFLDMVEALNIDSRETGHMEFPVKKVKGVTMVNVVEWCNNHINVPEPVTKEKPDTCDRIWFDFTEQETDFFKALQTQEVIDLANAADYLGIHHLYMFCCQNLAQRIKDVNFEPEKIREMFDLTADMTDNEMKAIREKHVWVNY